MAIGKNSRRSSSRSSIRAPKFLDKSSGFYGRLDEPEITTAGEEVKGNNVEEDRNRERRASTTAPSVEHGSGTNENDGAEAFDFSEGVTGDDGETLLSRKPNRLSSRWRRSSRRKQKDGKVEEDSARGMESPAEPQVLDGTRVLIEVEMEKMKKMEDEKENMGRGKEPALVHFQVREDKDDQVLIRDKKRGREEEGEEERRMTREQEEGMKMLKRNTMRNYRKALDRALRRGWEAFITNISSVTVTPVAASSPPPSPSLKKKQQLNSVLAEFR